MCSCLLETELKTGTQVKLHSLIIFLQKVLGHSWTYRSSHQDDDDDFVPTFKALWHSLESPTSKTQKTMDLHKLSTLGFARVSSTGHWSLAKISNLKSCWGSPGNLMMVMMMIRMTSLLLTWSQRITLLHNHNSFIFLDFTLLWL